MWVCMHRGLGGEPLVGLLHTQVRAPPFFPINTYRMFWCFVGNTTETPTAVNFLIMGVRSWELDRWKGMHKLYMPNTLGCETVVVFSWSTPYNLMHPNVGLLH